MNDVFVIGIGQIPVSNYCQDLATLAIAACRNALADAGIQHVDAIVIGNMLSSETEEHSYFGPQVAMGIGNKGGESWMVNAACASGGVAVRQACMAIASGECDVVLAVGVEKMSGLPRPALHRALASAASVSEIDNGDTFLSLNARLMRAYLCKYTGVDRDDFAVFSEIAHANANANPNARLKSECSRKVYESSPILQDPLRLHDASPVGDGAAAVVLASKPLSKFRFVRVAGSACATDTMGLAERDDPLWFRAAEESTRRAMSLAGINSSQVDLCELHDAFTIVAAISLESSGFASRGTACKFASDGILPISTMGGLKARGHPVGASGVYQVVDAVTQLRGAKQIPSVAMTQNMGGNASTVITTILKLERS